MTHIPNRCPQCRMTVQHKLQCSERRNGSSFGMYPPKQRELAKALEYAATWVYQGEWITLLLTGDATGSIWRLSADSSECYSDLLAGPFGLVKIPLDGQPFDAASAARSLLTTVRK